MINKEELLQKIPELLNEVKSKNPLTHCLPAITVVINLMMTALEL